MKLKYLLIIALIGSIALSVEGARDNRRKKQKKQERLEAQEEENDQAGEKNDGGSNKDNESKDRAMAHLEREKERKDGQREKEEDSSEEKDKKDEEKSRNSTEIVIPKFRRDVVMKKAEEINDGVQKPLDKKPSQTSQRNKRDGEVITKKAGELNDGVQKPLDKRPTQESQPRFKRDVELKKASEINDGKRLEIGNTPNPSATNSPSTRAHRLRRQMEETKEPHRPQTAEEKQFVYGKKHIRTHGMRPPTQEDRDRVQKEKEAAERASQSN